MFASNGEALKDFDVFHPDRMASRILGMGDVLTLIEQAEKTFDAEESRRAAEKIASKGGKDFGLADFLSQMQMVRKMGPLSKVFGMLPGMGEIKDQISNIDEKDVDRIEAIIHSMTPAERNDPKIIDGPPRPDRPGCRGPGLRRQRTGQPVLRGPQDVSRWPAARCRTSPGCRG